MSIPPSLRGDFRSKPLQIRPSESRGTLPRSPERLTEPLAPQCRKCCGRIAEVGNGFSLRFRAYMTPWTQECMYFILLTLSDTGIGVEPDPLMRGLGLEEQWVAPWSDVMSLQLVHQPEPIVRIEFSISSGQTAIRDIRMPAVQETPFIGHSGAHLAEAILLAYQEKNRPPNVEQVIRVLLELRDRRGAQNSKL
jgi:hypothetical protein